MSFMDRITNIEEEDFVAKTQATYPKAIMVRPVGATWDYNPVPVHPDINHGTVNLKGEDVDSNLDNILESINEIKDTLFG